MNYTLELSDKKSSFRGMYATTLATLIQQDSRIMVLEADLMKSSATDALFRDFPNQCINFGISEANMISAAGGMSKAGQLPFAHSFAPFVTRRALDQIYMSIAYSNNNLFIYGSDAGMWSQRNGGTHTANEDIAVMRSIPNMVVFDPSDPIQFQWIMKQYVVKPSLYYVRGARKNDIQHLYAEDSSFDVGKGIVLREGKSKIAFIASGMMVHEALRACELLSSHGIDPTVIDFFCLKPVDHDLLDQIISANDLIVAVENHSTIGGLGSIVAYAIAQSSSHPHFRHLSIPDAFGEVGSLDFLQKKFRLTADDIVQETLSAVQ